ncbi:hypothetical protein CDL15_Pgr012956 [Punica granatum]|nr:hypothetical protein CDL15_Pgr012956 [Punica granatum]
MMVGVSVIKDRQAADHRTRVSFGIPPWLKGCLLYEEPSMRYQDPLPPFTINCFRGMDEGLLALENLLRNVPVLEEVVLVCDRCMLKEKKHLDEYYFSMLPRTLKHCRIHIMHQFLWISCFVTDSLQVQSAGYAVYYHYYIFNLDANTGDFFYQILFLLGWYITCNSARKGLKGFLNSFEFGIC